MPTLTQRFEDGAALPVLVWRFRPPRVAVSTAPLGGGIARCGWVVNATVPMSYHRTDPDRHLTDLARQLGLTGTGVGLLTGVDVADRAIAGDGGVTVVATVGIGTPTWAAAPDEAVVARPGTINLVVGVPVRLGDAALVNAVATATEAKVQALADLGVPGTGTATDAVCVLCPADGDAERYGGPRSVWGARIARAVYAAVRPGDPSWAARGRPWLRH